MITVEIPDAKTLQIEYLVLDYNGTLACDGIPLEGVLESLAALSEDVEIHVVTADTFGRVRENMRNTACRVVILPAGNQGEAKAEYVRDLGSGRCAAVGNGRNDALMLAEAVLGIAVVSGEGSAAEAVRAADVICASPLSALGLLRNPPRLAATLRS